MEICNHLRGRSFRGSTEMAGKRKKYRRKQTLCDRDIALLISMLIGFMGYFVNIRPKIGEYGCGFADCFLLLAVLILFLLRIKQQK